jgi:DNA-binding MarR family transcriptional regulator
VTKITETWTPLPALVDDFAAQSFRDFHARLNEAGHPSIRAGHGCVFRFIHEGGSRLTELAATSGLSKQAVGEVVDDLEQLGYVERAADAQDRRAKVIRLTKRGAEAQSTARAIFSDMERNWSERYGAERVEAMRSLLEEVSRERTEAVAAGRSESA